MSVNTGTERTEDTLKGRERPRLVLRGILPDDGVGTVLEGAELTLGRDASNDIVLERGRVSRAHAMLYRQGPIYALRDLSSTNGTYVNGKQVDHAAISPGMVLRMGDWLGIVEELLEDELDVCFGELAPGVFGGPLLARTLEPLLRAAKTDIPILLVGRTGTGKERFAHVAHQASGRRGPLHAVNGAALPPALAEGELFGYQRGAFTGADRAHEGHLRAAHGGTLFLDELADLALPLQAKLLRALEEFKVTPLGDTRAQPFDARLITACQQPPEVLVREGRLREDLAVRLSGLVVAIPTLSERRGDIPGLFHAFLSLHSGGRPPPVSTRLYEELCRRDWSGNVRELGQLARALLAVHGDGSVLRRSHLPPARTESERSDPEQPEAPKVRGRFANRKDHDLAEFAAALGRTAGNVKQAAELAGISRGRAYRLLDGKDPADFLNSLEGGGGRDE
jgi:transcriptional regulator of acetoin/glycerol metabolism